ncbi:MAG: thiamine-phosphate kinase [Thermoplasmatota archaeon]
MRVSGLGERKVVRDILRLLGGAGRPEGGGAGAAGALPGDDCAVIEWGNGYLLATSDVVTPRTHVPAGGPTVWGWHAAAVNLSDIAAKGGEPLGLLVSLLIPPDTEERVVLGLMRGARDCCARHGTRVLGGDTKEGVELAISGTALGRVPREELMPRGGARPGDILAVTGELGAAAAGFLELRRGCPPETERRSDELRGGARGGALGRLLLPRPRLREGRAAARTRRVRACTDISDGLSASIHQLCEASRTGAEVELACIPISPRLLEQLPATGRRPDRASGRSLSAEPRAGPSPAPLPARELERWALHFGGDYELLMAIPPEGWGDVRAAVFESGTPLTPIGRVTGGRRVLLVEGGQRRGLRYGGWEHFSGGRGAGLDGGIGEAPGWRGGEVRRRAIQRRRATGRPGGASG